MRVCLPVRDMFVVAVLPLELAIPTVFGQPQPSSFDHGRCFMRLCRQSDDHALRVVPALNLMHMKNKQPMRRHIAVGVTLASGVIVCVKLHSNFVQNSTLEYIYVCLLCVCIYTCHIYTCFLMYSTE